MDDERCDCLFSRAKPQFLGAVNVDSGMHSHAGAWERGMGSHHSRKGFPVIPAKVSPVIPAKLPVIPAKAGIPQIPRHSREGGNPSGITVIHRS